MERHGEQWKTNRANELEKQTEVFFNNKFIELKGHSSSVKTGFDAKDGNAIKKATDRAMKWAEESGTIVSNYVPVWCTPSPGVESRV